MAQSTSLVRRAVGAVGRVFRPLTKSYLTPRGSGFVPANWPANFWQMGYDPLPYGGSAVVYACRAAYAQTIAMCPGTHWQSDGKGGRMRMTSTALSRILRKPNSYQSPSDFFLYLTDCLYGEGEAFGLALRNARFEIDQIHLMDPRGCWPRVAENGELFYTLSGNEIVERMFAGKPGALNAVPVRDVLHIRFPDKRNPLIGMPPLLAAELEAAVGQQLIVQSLAYAKNQGRPSGVIQGEQEFDEAAAEAIRAQWNRQTQGVNAGGTPVLSQGLKWIQSAVTSRDAQLAEVLKISDERIASVYRVPLSMLSLTSGQGPQGSTQSQLEFWVSSGLGFGANHIEDGFGRLFALFGWPDDYLELDLEALLRANFKDRIEGLARGVQSGIFSPNEARAREEYSAVEFGDEPRVQQQVVPLSAWDKAPPMTPAPPAPDAPPPAPSSPPNDGASFDDANNRVLAKHLLDAADEYDRRAA